MNEIVEIMENEMTDLRSLKKQQLIKINNHFGNIFKKNKITRQEMIELLIPIHRRMVMFKKIISGHEDCPICFNHLDDMNHIITNCGHAFCTQCIFKYITTEKELCPLCREKYTYEDLIQPFTPKDVEFLICIVIQNNEIDPIEQEQEEEQQEQEEEEQQEGQIEQFRPIYIFKNFVLNLFNLFMNFIFLWKSIIFLYKMIVHPFTVVDGYYIDSSHRIHLG